MQSAQVLHICVGQNLKLRKRLTFLKTETAARVVYSSFANCLNLLPEAPFKTLGDGLAESGKHAIHLICHLSPACWGMCLYTIRWHQSAAFYLCLPAEMLSQFSNVNKCRWISFKPHHDSDSNILAGMTTSLGQPCTVSEERDVDRPLLWCILASQNPWLARYIRDAPCCSDVIVDLLLRLSDEWSQIFNFASYKLLQGGGLWQMVTECWRFLQQTEFQRIWVRYIFLQAKGCLFVKCWYITMVFCALHTQVIDECS